MRHLFVELPYYTAEFLNIWMKSDSDEILDELYNDWIGTALYNPYTKEFYKKIKVTVLKQFSTARMSVINTILPANDF